MTQYGRPNNLAEDCTISRNAKEELVNSRDLQLTAFCRNLEVDDGPLRKRLYSHLRCHVSAGCAGLHPFRSSFSASLGFGGSAHLQCCAFQAGGGGPPAWQALVKW